MKVRKAKVSDRYKLRKFGIDKYHWEFIRDPHYIKFLALEGSDLLGIACVSITLDTANLDFIHVRSDARSKGVGKELLRAVEHWAKKRHADGLGVNCGRDNKGAIRFYKREGFKKVGQVYNYFSNNNTQVFFWKKP